MSTVITELDRLESELKYAKAVLHEAEIRVSMAGISVEGERFVEAIRQARLRSHRRRPHARRKNPSKCKRNTTQERCQ